MPPHIKLRIRQCQCAAQTRMRTLTASSMAGDSTQSSDARARPVSTSRSSSVWRDRA